MPCYHPVDVTIYRKIGDGPRVPWVQTVPCGHCLGCRAEQARQWTVRILHEKQMHDAAWFLTLTYNDEEMPENGSLKPKDLQRFFKALRKAEARKADEDWRPISFYACGEYGERTKRPHYHAILFGPDFLDKYLHRPGVWRSPHLEDCWTMGNSEFGTVTASSAAYVAGYVRKKISRKVDPDAYERVDPDTGELVHIKPEFSRMSLRPAIGKRWIRKYWRDVYPADRVVIAGWEGKPPRFYDKWLEEHEPEMAVQVKKKRYEEMEDCSPYTLEAKEAIHASRLALYGGRDKI